MALREILTYPDPRIKKVSRPVGRIDRDIRVLIDDMAETMYDAPGVGLAAPQVGILLRVIVVDVSSHQEGIEPVSLINPELIWSEGEIIWEEGCLSVPELAVEIPRRQRIGVAGIDPSGQRVEIEAEGLFAVALQHEMDHLNGRLIIDHLSPLKREMYRKKRIKDAAQAGR